MSTLTNTCHRLPLTLILATTLVLAACDDDGHAAPDDADLAADGLGDAEADGDLVPPPPPEPYEPPFRVDEPPLAPAWPSDPAAHAGVDAWFVDVLRIPLADANGEASCCLSNGRWSPNFDPDAMPAPGEVTPILDNAYAALASAFEAAFAISFQADLDDLLATGEVVWLLETAPAGELGEAPQALAWFAGGFAGETTHATAADGLGTFVVAPGAPAAVFDPLVAADTRDAWRAGPAPRLPMRLSLGVLDIDVELEQVLLELREVTGGEVPELEGFVHGHVTVAGVVEGLNAWVAARPDCACLGLAEGAELYSIDDDGSLAHACLEADLEGCRASGQCLEIATADDSGDYANCGFYATFASGIADVDLDGDCLAGSPCLYEAISVALQWHAVPATLVAP